MKSVVIIIVLVFFCMIMSCGDKLKSETTYDQYQNSSNHNISINFF